MTDSIQPPRPSTTSIGVSGAGVAGLPIPFWVKALRAAVYGSVFASVVLLGWSFFGWDWIFHVNGDEIPSSVVLAAAVVVTIASGSCVALFYLGIINKLFRVEGKTYKGFYRDTAGLAQLALALVIAAAIPPLLAARLLSTSPIPSALSKIELQVPAPSADAQGISIYLWDYSIWFSDESLKNIDVVLPYEKGPPQRLLSRILFVDPHSQSSALELSGRRPRTYNQHDVYALFESQTVPPALWSFAFTLQKEAGIRARVNKLYLVRNRFLGGETASSRHVTEMIGVPPDGGPESGVDGAASTSLARADENAGRFFYWGPDGSVFQAKCPTPCRLARSLELVQFPEDPRGSHAQRLSMMRAAVKKLLESPLPENEEARQLHEKKLMLYLLSLLTLDPRDAEAFFHLGKLSHNPETISSVVRYGKDVGMDHARLMELESAH